MVQTAALRNAGISSAQQYGSDAIPVVKTKRANVAVIPSAEARKGPGEVYLEYVKTKAGVMNGVVKPIYTTCDWISRYNPANKDARTLAGMGKDAKNFCAVAELPGATVELAKATTDVMQNKTMGSVTSLLNRVGLLLIPAIDFLRVVSDKIRPMTAATARTVTNVFNTAVAGTTGYGIVEELRKINRERTEFGSWKVEDKDVESLHGRVVEASNARITQSCLKIGMFVSYFAIAALGLSAAFANVVVPSVTILALATSGLAFSVLAHFHNKMSVETLKAEEPQGRFAVHV